MPTPLFVEVSCCQCWQLTFDGHCCRPRGVAYARARESGCEGAGGGKTYLEKTLVTSPANLPSQSNQGLCRLGKDS